MEKKEKNQTEKLFFILKIFEIFLFWTQTNLKFLHFRNKLRLVEKRNIYY